jgi:hypothetical protein
MESAYPTPETTGLQFDQAEISQPEPFQCAACHRDLYSSYWEIGGKSVCESCRYTLQERLERRPGLSGGLKALAAGFGAALLGSGIYYGVRELTGYEIGLVAILVGYLVGRAVRWGSGNRGGRGFQILAVFLTYMAIVSTYLPPVLQAIAKQNEGKPAPTFSASPQAAPAAGAPTSPMSAASPASPTSANTAKPGPNPKGGEIGLGGILLGIGGLLLLVAIAPFLAGVENLIGLVIIAIGVWQAWQINRRTNVEITGPFAVGRPVPAQPAA